MKLFIIIKTPRLALKKWDMTMQKKTLRKEQICSWRNGFGEEDL